MKISFEMTGGYGGLFAARPLRYDQDTLELPPEIREEVERLVHETGVLDLEPMGADAGFSGRPDVYQYRLSLSDAGIAKEFCFDDVTAPPAVRPLLSNLQQRAVERRLSGS